MNKKVAIPTTAENIRIMAMTRPPIALEDEMRLNGYGYLEWVEKGNRYGTLVHRAVMEEWLGCKLRSDQQVHHIDRDRMNNEIDNLALATPRGHGRIHAFDRANGYEEGGK